MNTHSPPRRPPGSSPLPGRSWPRARTALYRRFNAVTGQDASMSTVEHAVGTIAAAASISWWPAGGRPWRSPAPGRCEGARLGSAGLASLLRQDPVTAEHRFEQRIRFQNRDRQ